MSCTLNNYLVLSSINMYYVCVCSCTCSGPCQQLLIHFETFLSTWLPAVSSTGPAHLLKLMVSLCVVYIMHVCVCVCLYTHGNECELEWNYGVM